MVLSDVVDGAELVPLHVDENPCGGLYIIMFLVSTGIWRIWFGVDLHWEKNETDTVKEKKMIFESDNFCKLKYILVMLLWHQVV